MEEPATVTLSSQVAVVVARRLPSDFPEDGREGARLAITESQTDFGHRVLSLSQHDFRPLDTLVRMVTMRWDAEGLFERSAEMKCT